MGNYISCTLSNPAGKNCKAAAATKVLIPSGEIRHFYEPVKAAELMLDTPNFFLVNTKSLHMGRRFSALNADEDLEFANVYVMFPMNRLTSTVTAADMGALFLTATAANLKSGPGSKVRVQPAYDDDHHHQDYPTVQNWRENNDKAALKSIKLNLDDIEEFSAPEFMHRLSMCRSKKPLLETIAEEPVTSR